MLDLEALDREIGTLAAHISAATCRWLLLVAEFERRGAHERYGFSSCARWLAWRCSVAERAAWENMRVARALGDLPRIKGSFARGRLSYSKVRALTRAASPVNETELLELAEEATAAQLERIVAGYRRAISADEAVDQRERRHLSMRWEDDGMLRINGLLPAEEGALLKQAIELVRDRLRAERVADALADGAPRDEREEQVLAEWAPAPSAADAVVEIADGALAAEARPQRAGADRHQIVVYVDLADLGRSDGDGSNGLIDGRVPIAPEAVRRIGCDASLVALIEHDGEALSVGRKTRSIPPAIARALSARDDGCRFPGCGSKRFLDAHHVEHWAQGGPTSLSNLVQLCGHHHRLVHEGGFTVEMAGGEPTFRRPSGDPVPDVPEPLAGQVRGCRGTDGRWPGALPVDGWAIAARSRGESFDLGLTVATLAGRRGAAAALS